MLATLLDGMLTISVLMMFVGWISDFIDTRVHGGAHPNRRIRGSVGASVH